MKSQYSSSKINLVPLEYHVETLEKVSPHATHQIRKSYRIISPQTCSVPCSPPQKTAQSLSDQNYKFDDCSLSPSHLSSFSHQRLWVLALQQLLYPSVPISPSLDCTNSIFLLPSYPPITT